MAVNMLVFCLLHQLHSLETQLLIFAPAKEGLSKMKRNHIHLAQGKGGKDVISGMRRSSQVFIYIDVDRAIAAGIKFELSNNGVVLTEGDERGFLPARFFQKVEDAKGQPLPGWSEEECAQRAKKAEAQ